VRRIRILLAAFSISILLLGVQRFAGAADAAQSEQKQTAEQLFSDYKAATPVEPDAEKLRSDPAYREQARKEYQAALEKQQKIGQQLIEQYPDDDKVSEVIPAIWMRQAIMKPQETLPAIERFITTTKNKKNANQARYIRALATIRSGSDFKSKVAAADQFIAEAPEMKEQAANLLLMACDSPGAEPGNKDEVAAIQKRVMEEYPDTPAAKHAVGLLKLAEGVGKPFELSFTDAISGKKISVADLKGKVIVVDFWATWCGPCVGEMPKMKKLYAEFKDKGVEFIGVSLDQNEAQGGLKALKEFVAKNEIGWPQYYQGNAWESEFSRGWGINAIPRVFIIDADGKLFSTQGRGQLETILPQLIKKRDGVVG
jgi:thiol-disulfide isomerase/thioredoxin